MEVKGAGMRKLPVDVASQKGRESWLNASVHEDTSRKRTIPETHRENKKGREAISKSRAMPSEGSFREGDVNSQ